MERFLRVLPPPSHSVDDHKDSDGGANSKHTIHHYSDSSSSNSSLSSQSSLASLSSLTPPPPPPEQSSTTTTAAICHHHCSATIKGHSSYIFSLALSGKQLHSGSSNGDIRAWNCNPSSENSTYSTTYTVAGGYSAVKSIVVLNNNIFTAHQDHKIRVWKIDSATTEQNKYQIITTLPTKNDRCMRMFCAKNYVKVRRHKKTTWVHHVDTVSALALSKDGSFLYSVSWDKTIKVWRTSDFKCIESVQKAHDDAINAAVLSHDGLVYTGSADKKIKVWKKNDTDNKHSLITTLEKHKSAVNALALSSDDSVMYSGACDRSIIVWEKGGSSCNSAHMVAAGALKGHNKAILCLTVVSDLLCSGSADKTVRIWRRGIGNNHSCLAVFEGHTSPVKCLAAGLVRNYDEKNGCDSRKSYLIYSGSLDFDIKVWQILVPF